MAEYERAQSHERTRRGRLEKARRGEFIPWAYRCYGYRYLPKRHGCVPQVVIAPEEAEVVRQLYRALVEEQVSCRQLTKRLNDAPTPTPSGKNPVWQPATVRTILTNRVYTGQARYNYRQPVLPKYRKVDETQIRYLKTGRSYRSAQDWVWSAAPALIPPELFEKAQLQLQRNAETARKMYQPTSRRYLLRTLVKCGECGLGMVASHQRSACKKYEYLYYECKGHTPLTCGRVTKCPSRRVRADRLDAVVWESLNELLRTPTLLPQLHHTWVQAKQQTLTALTAQHTQVLQRKQRVERQVQRLVDAYQAEIITLSELQLRRQKLTTELQHLDQELHQLTHSHRQTLHWQQVIEHVEHFRHLLGDYLERLSFADRQTVAQCLIKKVVVTGEQVDISYILPFDCPPQVYHSSSQQPEGTPGHFYRLRLADLNFPPQDVPSELFNSGPQEAHRQIGEQLPYYSLGVFHWPSFTGFNDRERQLGIRALFILWWMHDQRQKLDRQLGLPLFSLLSGDWQTIMALHRGLGQELGDQRRTVAGDTIHTGANQKPSALFLREAEELINVAFPVPNVNAAPGFAHECGGLVEIL